MKEKVRGQRKEEKARLNQSTSTSTSTSTSVFEKTVNERLMNKKEQRTIIDV